VALRSQKALRLGGAELCCDFKHIHLLLKDDSEHRTIPQAIGLIAGRTAQEYNQRKKRRRAFWEDRYHATAIETGEHLLRCLALKITI